MYRKNCFIFDIFVLTLLVILCQTLCRMRSTATERFCPLFVEVAKEDATYAQQELSRFFLYLSNVLRPKPAVPEIPLFLTQLDLLAAQLARAHHAAHQSRYTEQQRNDYQQATATLLSDIEKTAHDYLKERTSARLLTPNGLSTHITSRNGEVKKGLALTRRAHRLFETMDNLPVAEEVTVDSIEQGLRENERLLQHLTF